MSIPRNLTVSVGHDVAEGIWHIVASEVPGLNAEAETLDELVAVIADLAPELIAANLPGVSANTPLNIQHTVNSKQLRTA